MRKLLIICLSISLIGILSCSDSSTGPGNGDDGGDDGDGETTTYTVDVSSTDGGSVDPSGSTTYEEGEEVEIEASSNEEYTFSGWTGDVEGSDNPLTLTVDQDYELTGNFEIKSYELTVNSDGEGEVTEQVVEEKAKEYESGTVVELTANPADGYKFVEWTGDLTGTENPAQITVDDPKEVTAVFEKSTGKVEVTTSTSGEDQDSDGYSFSIADQETSIGINETVTVSSIEEGTYDGELSGIADNCTVEGENPRSIDVTAGETASTTFTVSCEAQTKEIGSNITSDRTLTSSNDYLVTSNISVEEGATLTIEPGTQVFFESGTALKVNGAMIAEGTAGEPIKMTATKDNQEPGWWKGLAFYSNNANNSLAHVEVRHAGRSSMDNIREPANVAVANGATASITNSTIADGENYGLVLDDDESSLESFSANSFSANGTASMWIPFSSIGKIDSETSFPSDDYVRVFGSFVTLESDATVAALSGDTPYRFSSTAQVGENVTLTVSPGVQFSFESNVAFHVNGGAALVAEGTADNPIVMRAPDGNAQQGWWKGLAFYSNNANNSLAHVEVRHAGRSSMDNIREPANVAVANGATASITNSTIADGENYGLVLDDDESSLESFSANSFSANGTASMWIPFSSIGKIDSETSFPSDGYVRVFGSFVTLESDATVAALSGDTPYRFSSTAQIGEGTTLTVSPGVQFSFESNVAFIVNGGAALVAEGTADNPIVMRAPDGNAQQGWWKGLAFYSNNANNSLAHVEVRHAGRSSMDRIYEPTNVGIGNGATASITNSTIADSDGWGIYCNDENSITQSGNEFSNNASGNIGCK